MHDVMSEGMSDNSHVLFDNMMKNIPMHVALYLGRFVPEQKYL